MRVSVNIVFAASVSLLGSCFSPVAEASRLLDTANEGLPFLPRNLVGSQSCATAPVLAVGDTVNGSTEQVPTTLVDDCSGGTAGLFFKVIGTGHELTASTCHAQTNFDTILSVRKGSCASSDCVDWIDDPIASHCSVDEYFSILTFDTVQGEVYYIHVSAYDVRGTFRLSLEEEEDSSPEEPPCEEPEVEDPLSVGGTIDYDALPFALRSLQMTACSLIPTTGLFLEVVGTGDTLQASTCHEETEANTALSVQTGNCDDGFECLIQNDDDEECEFGSTASTVVFDTEEDEIYHIFVSAFAAEGKVRISLVSVNTPAPAPPAPPPPPPPPTTTTAPSPPVGSTSGAPFAEPKRVAISMIMMGAASVILPW